MGNEVDDKAVAKPVVGDQAEGGVKDEALTAADRMRADAAKALPAETGTGAKDADDPNLPKVEVTGDDEAEAAKKAAAEAEAAKKAAAEGDAQGDPTKKATEGDPDAAAVERLKGAVQKGDVVDPGDTPGIKDAAAFKTGTEIDNPGGEKAPDGSEKGPDAADKRPDASDSSPEARAEMEKMKAQLDALFASNDPQKQLMAVGALAGDGITSLRMTKGNESHEFTLQKSEIAGNRGVSNPKYANMTHFYVDGKVALRGNELTNPGDGPKYDQQRHYKTGEIVDFKGTKGGPVLDSVQGNLEGSKIVIEKNGVKMEATAVKGADGQVSFEMKEIKPEPTPAELEANRQKEFYAHPEKFLPQLSGTDVEATLGVMKTMSDMDVQSVEVKTKGGETYKLNATMIEGADGKPPSLVLNMDGKTVIQAELTPEGIKPTADPEGLQRLRGIDWAGAHVKIDYANEKVEDREVDFPADAGLKKVTVQLEGAEAAKMMLGKLPEGDIPKQDGVAENRDAFAAFVEGSTGYKVPDGKTAAEIGRQMSEDTNAFEMVQPNQPFKPGDMVFVRNKEVDATKPVTMSAGIVRGDGQVVVPTGDGTEFKTMGSLQDLGKDYSLVGLRAKSLPVERVEEPAKAEDKPEVELDDIASLLKSPMMGKEKAFQWMDKDASLADIEKGILSNDNRFTLGAVDAATLDPKQLKNGDVLATGNPGEGKVAVFVQNSQYPDGTFVTAGEGGKGFKQGSNLKELGLEPTEDGKYRLYRANDIQDAEDAKAAEAAKTGETGNFDEMSAKEAYERINKAYENFKAANAGRDYSSLDAFSSSLKEATGREDLPEFKTVDELEQKLPELGYTHVTENLQVGDLVIMTPKVEGQGKKEVGIASEGNKIRFGKETVLASELAQNFDLKFYRAEHLKGRVEEKPAGADAEPVKAPTWGDRAAALGQNDYLAAGKPAPWEGAASSPFERGYTGPRLEGALSSFAISKELNGIDAQHFKEGSFNPEDVRGQLANQDSGFERSTITSKADPNSLKAGEVIFGKNANNEDYMGVVGKDGNIYSAKVGENNAVTWEGRPLSSFDGYRVLERYSPKDAAAKPADAPIEGPKDEAEAKDSAEQAMAMLTAFFEPTNTSDMPTGESLVALRNMGVAEITVSHPNQPDKKHVLRIGEGDGKVGMSADGKPLMDSGGYMNGQIANSFRFTNLAGITFEVKFINGMQAVSVVPDTSKPDEKK
ncbi:MAG: hypothetical protein R3C24_04255 [Cyanobacteriota/Melainabacteria group bacterium]